MNLQHLERIEESLRYSGTAIARVQCIFKDKLDDPGYDILRRLAQAQSDAEQYFSNRIHMKKHEPPTEDPLVWALRTALRDNPDIDDLGIASLVRQTLKEGWKK